MNMVFEPGLGVVPMTVIAFMKESEDSLLLAADQQFTGDGIRTYHPKLRRVEHQQLAWSGAGNPSIGLDAFGDWINSYDFTNKNWSMFTADAALQLSHLNGEREKMSRLSGIEYKPEKMGAEILLVGWLTNTPGAYTFSNDGGCFNILRYNFEAIGSGCKSAFVARTAIQKCQEKCKQLDGVHVLRLVMESVACHIDDCHSPIDIWRITKDSISPVSP